jgi:hypothetical protein
MDILPSDFEIGARRQSRARIQSLRDAANDPSRIAEEAERMRAKVRLLEAEERKIESAAQAERERLDALRCKIE